MHPFFLKSLLAAGLFFLSIIGIFTMFEAMGRTERKYPPEVLKKFHRLAGTLFLLLSLVVAYLCLDYLIKTKAEPSVRAMFHAVFSMTVLMLLVFKVVVVNFYRQYYARLQTAGLILAFASFAMTGTSAGYFLLVTKFGSEMPDAFLKEKRDSEALGRQAVRNDLESVSQGRALYEEKCTFCHDPLSNITLTGPGHKNILKNPLLPVSGKPATPENVASQLRNPHKDMPSFSYLTGEEVQALIAYLGTL